MVEKKGVQRLNAAAVGAAVAAGAVGRLWDGRGLYLQVLGPGRASWRFKHRMQLADGRRVERVLVLGTYKVNASSPGLTLEAARKVHSAAWEQVRAGADPMVQRRIERAAAAQSAAQTVQTVAEKWVEASRPHWSAGHAKKVEQALARDVYPFRSLGQLPVAAVTAAMIADCVDAIAARSVETARKVRQHLDGIFDYARVLGLRADNPVIKGRSAARALRRPDQHHPTVLDLRRLGEILRNADSCGVAAVVRRVHWLVAHTAVRLGEAVPAKWDEFDLDSAAPAWVIPRSRMKMRTARTRGVKVSRPDHVVPLSPAVAAQLRQWRDERRGQGKGFVFPSPQAATGHVSKESVEKMLRVTLGLRDTMRPHSWRSAFSTLAHEARDQTGARQWPEDVVELALDHVPHGTVRAAYDRGVRLDARRDLMTWWAEQLHVAQHGAEVVQIGARARA